jgi:hypothetical protein
MHSVHGAQETRVTALLDVIADGEDLREGREKRGSTKRQVETGGIRGGIEQAASQHTKVAFWKVTMMYASLSSVTERLIVKTDCEKTEGGGGEG